MEKKFGILNESSPAMGRLFQPFLQENADTAKRYGGVFGLSVAGKPVCAMGGTVKAALCAIMPRTMCQPRALAIVPSRHARGSLHPRFER